MILLGGRQTDGQTDGRTDQWTYWRMDERPVQPMDGWTDVRTHSLIYLPRYDSMVKETHRIEHFCRCSSKGSNSQSECSDFGNGPITTENCLATSGEIKNLPLVTNCDLPKIEKKIKMRRP